MLRFFICLALIIALVSWNVRGALMVMRLVKRPIPETYKYVRKKR
jgi:hypothetical protein